VVHLEELGQPVRVGSRQPDQRTVFRRNPAYWGRIEGNVQEVVYTPTGPDVAGELSTMAAAYRLAALSPWGWPTPVFVFLASVFLVMLDTCGGLPFLLSVKPSERTEMAAIYSSFRDVSGIFTPGIAWVVLLFSPVAGVMAATGVALGGAFVLAGTMHPRLGAKRQTSLRSTR
jgi:hypothetical protein